MILVERPGSVAAMERQRNSGQLHPLVRAKFFIYIKNFYHTIT